MRRSIFLSLWLLVSPAIAAAEAEDECPTWFPDFHCDRAGRYAGFITPMTFPYLFEDPFITTEVKGWAIWHGFADDSVMDGGEYRVFAVQARLAITDRLALIATKDGFIKTSPDEDVLTSESGWADIGFGLKYALIDDRENRFILTPSLRYEMTQGSNDVYQGGGQGVWIPAVSFGLGLDQGHMLGAVGIQLPVDGSTESTSWFYNLQVGWPLTERLTPFASFNGMTWVDDGDGSNKVKSKLGDVDWDAVHAVLGAKPVEGVDVANLGTPGTDGHDYFTWAVGFDYALTERISFGFAYSRPVSKARREITKQRFSFAVTWGL
jgi:outer membrane receptor protein involved in Fe transport